MKLRHECPFCPFSRAFTISNLLFHLDLNSRPGSLAWQVLLRTAAS
ncbi:MAG: hypothetical protein ACK2T2_11550 [Anaerolineales bacterium]